MRIASKQQNVVTGRANLIGWMRHNIVTEKEGMERLKKVEWVIIILGDCAAG